MNQIHNIATGEWRKAYGKTSRPSKELLGYKIAEARKYVQHTGRGKRELAEYERQYVETFGLLQFVKFFDWFSVESLNPNIETG